MIEHHPITSRSDWLALRQRDVTASTAAGLLGVHPYVTRYSLWALKTGLIGEDAEESEPMRRGRLLEPVAIELLAEKRPEWKLRRPNLYLRDAAVRLGATPDVMATDAEGRPGIVQIKTTAPQVFRAKWCNEDGECVPPAWIGVQALIEAHLAEAQWCAVAVMTVDYGLHLDVVDVPLHLGLIERIRAEVGGFWQQVESKTPPEPDYAHDADLIMRLAGPDSGEVLDLTGDNRLPLLAEEDGTLAAMIRESSARRKAIKAEVIAKIGQAAAVIMDGETVVTARTVNRKGHTVPPSSYRDVRFKHPRKEDTE